MNNIGFKEIKSIEQTNFKLESEIIYSKQFNKENISKEIRFITFEDCIFEECTIDSKFTKCEFLNCKFINCDLSNILFIESSLHFITIKNCRMIGSSFVETLIKNSLLDSNMSDMINFSNVKLNNVNIFNNSLISSRFYLTKLNKVKFDNNKLNNFEVIQTTLNNIDLSNNIINGIKINLEDIKGCIIDSTQVYDLINLLNIKIK